ncbi:MAG: fibronectin type III domain-containing protein [Chthoniobacterales bacterium]
MAMLRVLLGFADAPDHDVEETAGAVAGDKGLFAHPEIYDKPPVDQPTLVAAIDVFTKAIANQMQGGTQSTAAKDEARAALIVLLRQLALYVQTTIQDPKKNYGLSELLMSGFDAVSTNRAQHPLDPTAIESIDNSGTGELTLRLRPSRNARMYEVERQLVGAGGTPGPWVSVGLFSSTRGVRAGDLEPGGLYNFRARAKGGSTGQSDWSDTVSHRSL